MKVIHKYEIGITGHIELTLPADSIFTDINFQDGKIYAWILHEHDAPREASAIFDIYAYPTGQPIPPEHASLPFCKTIHIPNKYIVMHYFYGHHVPLA